MRYEIPQRHFTSSFKLPVMSRPGLSKDSPSYYMPCDAWKYVKNERDCHSIIVRICEKCGTEIVGSWKYDEVSFDSYSYDSFALHSREWNKFTPAEYNSIKNISEKNRKELEYIKAEVNEFINTANCPVCHAKLLDKEDYIAINNFRFVDHQKYKYAFCADKYEDYLSEPHKVFHGVDALVERLKLSISVKYHNLVEQKRSKLIERYNNQFSKSSAGRNAGAIKENTDSLKEYLLKLLKIETDIYALTEWLDELYYDQINAEHLAYGSNHGALLIAEKKLKEARDTYFSKESWLKSLKSKGPERVSIPKPSKPVAPTPPVLETPGFFNKKKVTAQNAILTSQYEAQVTEYKLNMAEYERKLLARDEEIKRLTKANEESYAAAVATTTLRMEEAKEALDQAISRVKACQASSTEVVSPEKARKELIDSQVAGVENMLMQLIKCKYELYSCNIIFPKYRNPVALATFYEYLDSGRCSALEGAGGAYNLYEGEIRADRIIAQLDDVIDALDDIQENQYMIYSELSAANKKLDALKSTMRTAVDSISRIEANTEKMNVYMEKVAANSDVIAHNTAVNAYYSQVNAELTDALGYMVAMR